jgi:thiamine kinase-like enzyme
VLVIDYIPSTTLDAAGVRRDRDRCLALIKRAHRDIPPRLKGPILSFNVFHILRDYRHTLIAGRSRMRMELPRLAGIAEQLERLVGPIDLVLGHNDLLPANFLDDGSRLWLVDWDYAGFNSPLFDLGGLSSNNGFDENDDTAILEAYFEQPLTDALRIRFQAMRCASLLREGVWSMVSELHSSLNFDYVAYTAENMGRFELAWSSLQEFVGS